MPAHRLPLVRDFPRSPVALRLALVASLSCATSTEEGAEPPGPTTTDSGAVPADAAVDASGQGDASTFSDAAALDAAIEAAKADTGVDASTTKGVVFTGAEPTAQRGNAVGGTAFDDACPAGEALVGFAGSLTTAAGYHGQIAAQCGKAERTGGPGAYAIKITPGTTLPTRGAIPGTSPWTRTCAANQIISGFAGRSGTLVDQLTFTCVALLVDAAGTTVTLGTLAALAPIGGNGGSPFADTSCAAGKVATVARIRAGDSIDAFGLACGAPSIVP